MNEPAYPFNLWHDPWIRVTRLDGQSATLSIAETLAQAARLAALADPSPLVVGGSHRLLVAILQALYAPPDLGALAELLERGQFAERELDAFGKEYGPRFALFHPTTPFMQTGDVPLDGWQKPAKGQKHAWGEAKPITYLCPEVPTATNRTLYHHVRDEDHLFCPACCARGLITIPAFVMSGGSGNRPSINGEPPIYIFPVGHTLFYSLACSLVTLGFIPSTADPDRAEYTAWNQHNVIGKSQEVSAVGYLESLTFPARRIRLYPQVKATRCTHCGQQTPISVSSMLFEMGHWLSKSGPVWDDPFVALRKPRGKDKADGEPRPVRLEAGKALWREYSTLLLGKPDKSVLRPKVLQQLGKLIDDYGVLQDNDILRFRCTSIRNPPGKAIVDEWLDEALDAPPALLNDDAAAYLIEQALKQADEVRFVLESSFDHHFRPARDRGGQKAELARFKTVRARMTTNYWAALAPRFRQFIYNLSDEAQREEVEREWINHLIREGLQQFQAAAEQAGSQSEALRARVEADAEARRRLYGKRKEWLGE
ncbi:type I-E CRISPR-associated protein Cse1/CasA [Candidatus Viridilinea mediisalina]|uniref:Type I-E CRISPR-associated protein Cse1/CasA n=1 Tax=Candidatus Viridilinea mediisalina TaxID=2024553 RepID=A0A2A6REM7_9CHLR|nr:type I-E CRISPR-associated protein Cse1/CasA [Candidatus Viridilinea mediisalina]PDW01462.1 type I-E CRISPR-associated protein Cse1/CasA [Candidatus Viridilinea mediisalina]